MLEKWLEKYSLKTSLAEEITMQREVIVSCDILTTCYSVRERKKKKQRNDCFITASIN